MHWNLKPKLERAKTSPTYPLGIATDKPVVIFFVSPGLITSGYSKVLNKSRPAASLECFLGAS